MNHKVQFDNASSKSQLVCTQRGEVLLSLGFHRMTMFNQWSIDPCSLFTNKEISLPVDWKRIASVERNK